jgi:hypothetical protein
MDDSILLGKNEPYRKKDFEGWIREWWRWATELCENEGPEDHPLNGDDLEGKKFERSLLEKGDEKVVALGTQFDKEEGSPSVLRVWRDVPENTAIVLPLICLNVDYLEAQHEAADHGAKPAEITRDFKRNIAKEYVENDSYAFVFCSVRSKSRRSAVQLLRKEDGYDVPLDHPGITNGREYYKLAAFRHGDENLGHESKDTDSESYGRYLIFRGEEFKRGTELNIAICNGANFLGKHDTRFGTSATYQLLFK